MKAHHRWIVVTVLLLIAAVSCHGQEETPTPQQREEPPAPQHVLPPPICPRGCPTIKVLPVQLTKPVTTIVPREVYTSVKRPTMTIVYKEKKKYLTEIVMKPCEVLKRVPHTTLKPCQVVDPCTGRCSVVMQPYTELRVEKETVFRPFRQTRVVVVKVPFLKTVEETVPQRTILLENKTHMQSRTFMTPVPGGPVLRDRYLMTPRVCPPGYPH